MELEAGRWFGNLNPANRERERQTEQFRSATHGFTDLFRDMYLMEGTSRGLIDFDLAPADERTERLKKYIVGGPQKVEKRQVFVDLMKTREFFSQIKKPTVPTLAQQYDMLWAKLYAYDTFMQQKLGATYEFHDYVEPIMGITPEIIEESRIQAELEVVRGYYKEVGVSEYSKEAINRYKQEHQVPEQEIGSRLREKGDQFLEVLSAFLGTELKPNYEVEGIKVDDYWLNWASGIRDNFKLQYNTHSRHNGKWTEGKIEDMAIHEIMGHFGQMYGWQKSIDNGDLIPALGLTSVYDPEQVTSEGIAQTGLYFVPELINCISVHGQLEIAQGGLKQMVYNNIHIWANTMSLPEEDLIAYAQKYLPAETNEDVLKEIKDRSNDDIKRAYRLAYGYGYYLHSEYALCLNSRGKKELMKFIYSQPTTPQQEYDCVMQLVHDKEKRYGTGRIPFKNDSIDDDPNNGAQIKFPQLSNLAA